MIEVVQRSLIAPFTREDAAIFRNRIPSEFTGVYIHADACDFEKFFALVDQTADWRARNIKPKQV